MLHAIYLVILSCTGLGHMPVAIRGPMVMGGRLSRVSHSRACAGPGIRADCTYSRRTPVTIRRKPSGIIELTSLTLLCTYLCCSLCRYQKCTLMLTSFSIFVVAPFSLSSPPDDLLPLRHLQVTVPAG
ncbi:hypothetical protein JB92DRAFT_441093 [Gautieria morchelliformis]|nr:hypothetical protein JB92DRAFT_441093 [Gautieria morchelliformis]